MLRPYILSVSLLMTPPRQEFETSSNLSTNREFFVIFALVDIIVPHEGYRFSVSEGRWKEGIKP
jgi:hypothetical protein